MNKVIALTVFLGLALAVYGTASTASVGTFQITAQQVLDISNTTDGVSGGYWEATYTGEVFFGAGAANDTIYAYGVARTTSSQTAQPVGVVRRFINATIANWGNGTTAMQSVQIADVKATWTTSNTWVTSAFAVGDNYFAHVTLETASSTNKIYGYILASTGSSFGSAVTVYTAPATTSTNTLAIGNVWYQNGYFLVAVILQTTTANDAIYLNGVIAANSTVLFSTSVTVATGIASTTSFVANSNGGILARGGMGTSALALVEWVASTTTVKGVVVNVTAGTAGSALTITAGTNDLLTVGGVLGSTNVYGFAVGNNSGTASPYSLNLSAYANSTTTATATDLGFSFTNGYTTVTTTFPSIVWSTDYYSGTLIVASWSIGSSGNKYYAYKSIYANGTANLTQAAAFTELATTPSFFKDVAGGVWVGYYTVDTSTYKVQVASLARLFTNLTSSGNTLMSVIAFVSMIVMSLFMF